MNELDGRVYEGVRKAADSASAAMARRLDHAKRRRKPRCCSELRFSGLS